MLRSLAACWPRLRPVLPAAVIAASWPACSAGEGPLVAFLGDSLTSGWRQRLAQNVLRPLELVLAEVAAGRG